MTRPSCMVGFLAAILVLPGCFVISVHKEGYEDARAVSVPRENLQSVREVSHADEVPHFRTANREKLARLGPGAPVSDFKREFPGAIFVERRAGAVDCYRVDHAERYRFSGENAVYEVSDEAYFFFRDGRLVKWDMTMTWPK